MVKREEREHALEQRLTRLAGDSIFFFLIMPIPREAHYKAESEVSN